MSHLIGENVECKDRPNEIGSIIYYDSESGDIGLCYGAYELLTHISKCRVIGRQSTADNHIVSSLRA